MTPTLSTMAQEARAIERLKAIGDANEEALRQLDSADICTGARQWKEAADHLDLAIASWRKATVELRALAREQEAAR